MMPDRDSKINADLAEVKERVRKLAMEKAECQLLIRLIEKLIKLPGVDHTVDNLLQCVFEIIGGSNISIYYKLNEEIFYADALGQKYQLESLDDRLVEKAFNEGAFVEQAHEFSKSLLLTSEFTNTYTWYFPVTAEGLTLAVVKAERLVANEEMKRQMQIFFAYAAVILKNEIRGYSRLNEAYGELQAVNNRMAREIEERQRAERGLFIEKEQLRITFKSIGDGIITTDLEGRILTLNGAAEELSGWPAAEAVGKPFAEVFQVANAVTGEPAMNMVAEVLKANRVCFLENESILKAKDGRERHIVDSAAPIKDEIGNLHGVVMIFRDITDQKLLDDALRESERSRAVLLSNFPGLAYRCMNDPHWTMQFVSEGCHELTGYWPDDLIDNKTISYEEMIDPEYRRYVRQKLNSAITAKSRFREEYKITTAHGSKKWVMEQGEAVYDELGDVVALEGFVIDIDERKRREVEIAYISYHDKLTGLYNRRFFEEELKRLDTERNLPLSIIMGDVNGLKVINDAFGHLVGDELLQTVASILKAECRADEIIARIGGDEFVILLPKTTTATAEQLINRITTRFETESIMNVTVSVSFGCVAKEGKSQIIAEILRDAEDRMYRKKIFESASKTSIVIKSILHTLHVKSRREEVHSRRVSKLCEEIAMAMGSSRDEAKKIRVAGELHDIGKIAIDKAILNKNGTLTKAEWLEIRRHPETGYRLLGPTAEFYNIADFVLAHHERWDGSGYPKGLRGLEIPWESRIIGIADAYDAMTSDRPYRRALNRKEVLHELTSGSGTQFDLNITRVFIEKVLREPL